MVALTVKDKPRERSRGLELSLLLNWNEGSLDGAQVGLSNYTEKIRGVQVGFFGSYAKKLTGVQIGFIHFAEKLRGIQLHLFGGGANEVYGIQAGAGNMAEELYGVQVGGGLNSAERLRGIQIALLMNYCGKDAKGIQIGLCNFRDGEPMFFPGFAIRIDNGY